VLRVTGSEGGVIAAIQDAREARDLRPTDAVGVLDVTRGQDPPPRNGDWIVSPYAKGTT
jgi:hypothetical protein